jgi:hypothetical protein
MDTINQIVRDAVFWYAGGGIDIRLYPLANDEIGVYSVTMVDYPERKRPARVVVQARVEGDRVIIEEDTTDRPLVDRLVAEGIARTKIVLAYLGEPVSAGEAA